MAAKRESTAVNETAGRPPTGRISTVSPGFRTDILQAALVVAAPLARLDPSAAIQVYPRAARMPSGASGSAVRW